MSDHKQVRGAGGFPVICSARVEELIVGHASFLLFSVMCCMDMASVCSIVLGPWYSTVTEDPLCSAQIPSVLRACAAQECHKLMWKSLTAPGLEPRL